MAHLDTIPVEVLTVILRAVFALHPSRTTHTLASLMLDEIPQPLRRYASVVQTCRRCYDCGMPMLLELIAVVDAWKREEAAQGRLPGLASLLSRKPGLASYIRCVVVSIADAEDAAALNGILKLAGKAVVEFAFCTLRDLETSEASPLVATLSEGLRALNPHRVWLGSEISFRDHSGAADIIAGWTTQHLTYVGVHIEDENGAWIDTLRVQEVHFLEAPPSDWPTIERVAQNEGVRVVRVTPLLNENDTTPYREEFEEKKQASTSPQKEKILVTEEACLLRVEVGSTEDSAGYQ